MSSQVHEQIKHALACIGEDEFYSKRLDHRLANLLTGEMSPEAFKGWLGDVVEIITDRRAETARENALADDADSRRKAEVDEHESNPGAA